MDRDDGVWDKDIAGCSRLGLGGKNNDAFIDRSRVRILLCDNNLKSCEEAFTLLCNCSYQVTSVKSARQVIDALNAEGPDIDIILSEIDLPMAKGMKMLRYITRDNDLRRIPVIMMSAQDEVSTVVKCLRLGAADYLVKPLRTNELLNLWTHMWRRRRMLGLAEKNIMSYDFELVASDPSDVNTNSTTLFSDDTEDKSRKSTNPEMCMPDHQEDAVNVTQRYGVPNTSEVTPMALYASLEPPPVYSLAYHPDISGISDHRTGQVASCPRKNELRKGKSSAFFTYVKSSTPKISTKGIIIQDLENTKLDSSSQHRLNTWAKQASNDTCENKDTQENKSLQDDSPQMISGMETHSQAQLNPRNVLNSHSHNAYPYYTSGLTNQMTMPQYFPYYPMRLCPNPGQIWSSYGTSSPATNSKLSKVDGREAALMKFRQKRKRRCFDKKIRYVNRKRLAERRPRVRGQFVRKMNGIDVDLNGTPGFVDLDEDEDDDDENVGINSSPEDDV